MLVSTNASVMSRLIRDRGPSGIEVRANEAVAHWSSKGREVKGAEKRSSSWRFSETRALASTVEEFGLDDGGQMHVAGVAAAQALYESRGRVVEKAGAFVGVEHVHL